MGKGKRPTVFDMDTHKNEAQAEKMAKMSPIELLQFSPRLQKDYPSNADKPSFKWIGNK